jgi:hypothetical protein
MSFAYDPEIAAALAPMAGFTPPPVGDVARAIRALVL